MIGAIIGDIVGSRFEFNNHRSTEFELFTKECFVTDDSIMSLAVSKAMMETHKQIKPALGDHEHSNEYRNLLERMTIKYMQKIGRKYPNCGYGGNFGRWMFSENPEPYGSYGNGAAMRISPIGCVSLTKGDACSLSEIVTAITHNHEEGIKGSEATAVAIFMAKSGYNKSEIYDEIVKNYYKLDFTLDEIRDTYRFNETCQETVPQAIEAFIESNSFEDAIRKAISIGGDSDTLAAITGSIAEAYYGVPKDIRLKALSYLDEELKGIYDEWSQFSGEESIFCEVKVLTKYIVKINEEDSFGQWGGDNTGDGSYENPYIMPHVNLSELVIEFEKEFYQYSDAHSEYNLTKYSEILKKNGIDWSEIEMKSAKVETLDKQTVLALIMATIRGDRFSSGTLMDFFETGFILKWLKRIDELETGLNETNN